MDFRFTPEQEALRSEFEQFFREEVKNAPKGWIGGWEAQFENDSNWAYHRSVALKLGKKGWLSLPWPKKYGGQEHSYIEQAIFSEVRYYHRVPGYNVQGLQILVPSLLEYGSEEIKVNWLPTIARGETEWCQGWSEPNAGSDLASLTTRATKDGDDYVINGQKIWTTGAHRSDHIFILARTDFEAPKHKGLTYFLSEMNQPGITVRPLYFMNRAHVYNEVFFDNLRVPKRNIVGQLNQGWYVTMAGANFERSCVGGIGELQHDLEDLVQFCKETRFGGKRLIQNPIVQHKLAEFAVEIEAARQWAYYCVWLQAKNPALIVENSASKYFTSELMVRLANSAIDIVGLHSTLRQESKWASLKGKFENDCQRVLSGTIAGGPTEIHKNIIAQMGLQLPRTQ